MKRLIVVDMQNDFCLESGPLHVKGAMTALWNIEELLYSKKIEEVWFTADWHEIYHPSFIDQGGQWPIHCIQYSQGAAINDLLLSACRNNIIPYEVYTKGYYEEEYGAFGDFHFTDSLYYWTTSDDSLYQDRRYRDDEFIICGVAGDYCVLNTIKNLEPIWDRLSIYLPGIASVDDGTTLKKFIKQHNLKIYKDT